MATPRVEIVLITSARRYNLLPLNANLRSFFPGFKIPFVLETDVGDLEVQVTSADKGTRIGDSVAGTYICGGLSAWFRKHTELSPGDSIIVERVEGERRYRLLLQSKD